VSREKGGERIVNDLPNLPAYMAVRCFREVPLVKPCEILGRSEVEPEVVEQPRCLGGPFLGLRGPAPRRVAERRVFRLGIVEFITREPVEQISVDGEEVL
jgi:hypothetical protein